MKKYLSFLLAFTMVFSIAACDGDSSTEITTTQPKETIASQDNPGLDNNKTPSSTVTLSASPQPTDPTPEPTPEATPEPTPEPTPTPTPALYYSSNDLDTAKKGASGVFAYKNLGGTYDNYYIIDFDEGYVYTFTDGNGSTSCDRVKIDSGDLNDVVIITYHDGGDTWSYGLHFKWKNQPDHLILEDNDHFEYDFYPTDLDDALTVRDTKKITDY